MRRVGAMTTRPPPRIGFIVDHPKRDLPGAIMVAHALAIRDIETALVPLYEQAVDVPLLGLDGLVLNYARAANRELVEGFHAEDLPMWVLDTEGGVLAERGANAPDTLATYVAESGYGGMLTGYFFWGSRLHEAFLRRSGMSPRQLHVTGCPRFDYAAPRWRDVLTHDRRDFVLANSNFPLVNPRFARSPDKELQALAKAGWDRDYSLRLLDDTRAIFHNFMETIGLLASKFPNRTFLVRPHPFEDTAPYQAKFAEMPNVVVDGRGSVLRAIRNAACILHVNCATSIDALLLEKVPFSMEFLNTPHVSQHSPLPARVSRATDSFEELCSALEDVEGESKRFEFARVHASVVQPWFHLNDGNAGERVASVLAEHVATRPRRRSLSVLRSLAASRRRPRLVQRMQAFASNVVGSRVASALRAGVQPQRRDKAFHVAEVAEGLAGLARHSGRPAPSAVAARHPLTRVPLASILVRPPS